MIKKVYIDNDKNTWTNNKNTIEPSLEIFESHVIFSKIFEV